jgi:leucyl aminopeptidase
MMLGPPGAMNTGVRVMPESSDRPPVFGGSAEALHAIDVDLVCIPVFRDDDLGDVPGLDDVTGGDVARARGSGEFRGKLYESFITRLTAGRWQAKRLALVGAGRRGDLDAQVLWRIGSTAAHAARAHRAGSVAVVIRSGFDVRTAARAFADGLSLAELDVASYKRREEAEGRYPIGLTVVAPGADRACLAEEVARGRTIGQSVNIARALANEPGNVLTPREFAARVRAVATDAGLSVEVLDVERIRALKMGLLLGVAAGSAEPPQLVVLRYDPPGAPASPVLGLVGKGITFDSGGISIKPADGMERMKDDMSGGAAVAAALCALARLKGRFRALGVIPMTENMPGGRAMRPGDVLTGASGKTVEIINTDAEGRLILGDALWYAQSLGATHLVDVATLTGACMVALGRTASGLFAAPAAWGEAVRAAAVRGGDCVWPLPLFDEYRDQINSEIADIVNSGGRPGGAITAAWFLREFVGDRPWAHLDIAGTAWAEESKPYMPKGPTGVAVRSLVQLGLTGGQGG